MTFAATFPAHTPRAAALAVALAVTLLLCLGGAGQASARGGGSGGGGQEVRAAGSCGAGATSKVRLRSRDGVLRVQFEVDHNRARAVWRVVLVQDRRVVWRGSARTRGTSDAFEIERRLRDLPGADTVTARAWGPRGVTCAASATLPG